jgi:hypothetical protein
MQGQVQNHAATLYNGCKERVLAPFLGMMSSVRLQFALALFVTACLCTPVLSAAQHHTRKSKKKAVAKVQQSQPDPAPAPPPTPEQLPAIAPKLTYQNGLLTIVAQNSTLDDILRDVHSKTGANIDVPGPATERVVGQFGPGSPRDVLATLLNGSHFNYVMVGTPTSPDSVAQVILTRKTGGETPPSPSGTMEQPGMMAVQPPVNGQQFPPGTFPQPQVQNQPVDSPDEPAPDAAEETTDESAQDQDTGENTDEGAPEQVNPGVAGQNPNQPAVKTPEQLLQELQRQQQIMQQQQQGQNPGQQPVQPQTVYPIPQQQPQQEKQ